jgi:hypothetical protein
MAAVAVRVPLRLLDPAPAARRTAASKKSVSRAQKRK